MTLEKLRIFVDVAEREHMTRAAVEGKTKQPVAKIVPDVSGGSR